MSIKNLTCEYCKAQLIKQEEGLYKCEACGALYEDNIITEEESHLLSIANQDLRLGKFDDAYEKYSDIINKHPNCYEAYWGLCLCEHGVVFVDDILDNKKVPTCYNMEIKSFLEDPNYLKTLELCPSRLKQGYEELARKIEIIRKEWIEKASRIEPYDIFISFKQSDREKNIEKTKDYYKALELYNYLTYKCGFKVFFSPETLKGKISERYEPYIYAALNTAKVMLIYGECPEYINSTWVKNEWIRYLRKIKMGEKEPNSLVVIYKNFDAYELPKELRNIQALKADSLDFLDTLLNHINKILSLNSGKEKLERIEVKSGQISSKTRTIGTETIAKRELGANVVTTKDASIAKMLTTIKLLIDNSQFDMATYQLTKVLEAEPNNSEAKYLKFLIDNNISGTDGFKQLIQKGIPDSLLHQVEDIISSSEKDIALNIINLISDSIVNTLNKHNVMPETISHSKFENDVLKLYTLISQYDYANKDRINKLVLEFSCKTNINLKLFNRSIKELESNQVDEYIKYHLILLDNIAKIKNIIPKYASEVTGEYINSKDDLLAHYIDKILEVDEGNFDALFMLYHMTYNIKYLERSLQYASNDKEKNIYIERYVKQNIDNESAPFEEIIKYIPSDNHKLYMDALINRYNFLYNIACDNSDSISREKYIPNLKWCLNQLMIEEGETSERLFDKLKFELGCITDEDLIEYSIPLNTLQLFNDTLPNLDSDIQVKLLTIVEQQKRRIAREEDRLKNERIKAEKEIEKREKEAKENEERKQQTIKEFKKNLKKVYFNVFITLALSASFVVYTISNPFRELPIWSDIEMYSLLVATITILIKIGIYLYNFASKKGIISSSLFHDIIVLILVGFCTIIFKHTGTSFLELTPELNKIFVDTCTSATLDIVITLWVLYLIFKKKFSKRFSLKTNEPNFKIYLMCLLLIIVLTIATFI